MSETPPPGIQRFLYARSTAWTVAIIMCYQFNKSEITLAAVRQKLEDCGAGRLTEQKEANNEKNRIILDLSYYNLSPMQLRNFYLADSIVRSEAAKFRAQKDSL